MSMVNHIDTSISQLLVPSRDAHQWLNHLKYSLALLDIFIFGIKRHRCMINHNQESRANNPIQNALTASELNIQNKFLLEFFEHHNSYHKSNDRENQTIDHLLRNRYITRKSQASY